MDFSKIEIFKHFFSAAGTEEILSEIRQYKNDYGAAWLSEFQADFPDLTVIVDLIANHGATDAFLIFKEHIAAQIDGKQDSFFARVAARGVAFGFLETHKADIFKLHEILKAEIDKPRF
jgi:hypothetical protein